MPDISRLPQATALAVSTSTKRGPSKEKGKFRLELHAAAGPAQVQVAGPEANGSLPPRRTYPDGTQAGTAQLR